MSARVTLRRALPVALLVALAAAGLLERPRASPAVHRAEWLPAGDALVRTVRFGRGDTTAVLLHGYGESLIAWRGVADRLGRRFRVVAIDLPGFGLSDKPAGPYDVESMRRRVADFVGRATEGPLIVIGHSMGGEIAAALAMSEPRVVAAVLIAPAGDGLGDAVDSLPADVRGLAAAAPLILPVHDPAWLAEPEERVDYDPMLDSAYRAAAAAVLAQFDFSALRGRFGSLDMPVLLIWGRQDPTIPYAVGERIAAELPCGRLVGFDGAFHRPHQAQPDLVAAEIEHFFNGGRLACDD